MALEAARELETGYGTEHGPKGEITGVFNERPACMKDYYWEYSGEDETNTQKWQTDWDDAQLDVDKIDHNTAHYQQDSERPAKRPRFNDETSRPSRDKEVPNKLTVNPQTSQVKLSSELLIVVYKAIPNDTPKEVTEWIICFFRTNSLTKPEWLNTYDVWGTLKDARLRQRAGRWFPSVSCMIESKFVEEK